MAGSQWEVLGQATADELPAVVVGGCSQSMTAAAAVACAQALPSSFLVC